MNEPAIPPAVGTPQEAVTRLPVGATNGRGNGEGPHDPRERGRTVLDPAAITRALVIIGFAAVTIGSLEGFNRHGIELDSAPGAVVLVGFALLLAAVVRGVVRARGDLVAVVEDVAAPLLARTDPRTWFAYGFVVALPAIALHGRFADDADSGRILANVAYMRHHGLGLLRQTQDVFLPNVVYWITSIVGSPSLARWVPILTFLLLSGSLCAIAYRVTRSAAVAAVVPAMLASCPIVLGQSTHLALYTLTLTLAVIATYLAWTALDGDRVRVGRCALAALCFVAGAEAHSIGQVFIVLPGLLLFLGPWRTRARAAFVIYGTVAVLFIPRLALNLSLGGTHRVLSNYDTYTISKGYLDLINAGFYHKPVRDSLPVYAHTLWNVFLSTMSWQGIIVGGLALVGLFVIPFRARLVAIGFTVIFIGSILATKPAPYARYFLPLMPGFAILAPIGFGRVWQRLRSTRATVAVACLLVFALVAGLTFFDEIRFARQSDSRIARGPLRSMTALVNDGKGVIGVRSPQLLYVDDEIQAYGPLFLSEADYVMYLSWPSDEQVLAMFKRNNIGWVYIQSNRYLETLYPATWLYPTYHLQPRFISQIVDSPNFCRVYDDGTGNDLWKVGSCAANNAVGQFDPANGSQSAPGPVTEAP